MNKSNKTFQIKSSNLSENQSGWIFLNKPEGISSMQALSKIKGAIKEKINEKLNIHIKSKQIKIGHCGTLDPFASGVLIVGLGEMTKLLTIITSSIKEYAFNIKFGEETDTGDTEGEIINKNKTYPSSAQIEQAMQSFIGKIKQVPHKYSAVKVDGVRAYKLSRKNIDFELKAKEITIHDFKLEQEISDIEFSFHVRCSKGTYVRSLARDLCEKLNCFGHVSKLERTLCSDIYLSECDQTELEIKPNNQILKIIDPAIVLNFSSEEAEQLRNGIWIKKPNIHNTHPNTNPDQRFLAIDQNGEEIIGLVSITDNQYIKPERICIFKNK